MQNSRHAGGHSLGGTNDHIKAFRLSPVTHKRKAVLKVGLAYSITLTAYTMGRTVPTSVSIGRISGVVMILPSLATACLGLSAGLSVLSCISEKNRDESS